MARISTNGRPGVTRCWKQIDKRTEEEGFDAAERREIPTTTAPPRGETTEEEGFEPDSSAFLKSSLYAFLAEYITVILPMGNPPGSLWSPARGGISPASWHYVGTAKARVVCVLGCDNLGACSLRSPAHALARFSPPYCWL